MARRLSVKEKLLAYYLNLEMSYTQKKIAEFMEVSQPTITAAIKKARLLVRDDQYSELATDARNDAHKIGDSKYVKVIEKIETNQEKLGTSK